MANYGASENCIEWLRGERKATLSLSDPDMIKLVMEMATKDKAVEIVDKGRFTLCAVVPLDYVSIKKPRRKKDDGEDNPVRHEAKAEAPRKERDVLRKRRLPPNTGKATRR